MALEQAAQALVDSMHAATNRTHGSLPMEESRQTFKETLLALGPPPVEVGERRETVVPGPDGDIPVRLYWPGEGGAGGPYPAIVISHGGGWVMGGLESYENLSRDLCARTGMVVCNVDYRLAPEHKFPAGLNDICEVLRWVRWNAVDLNVDPDRIAVLGDSAGGNIAAGACLAARGDDSIRIAGQILLYANFTAAKDYTSPSREDNGNGEYNPDRAQIEWVIGEYLASDAERTNPLVSPLLEPDLSGLPPALIITAGYDTLRDEAREYAYRLKGAGVPVVYKCYDNTIHGFWCFAGVLDADDKYRNDYIPEIKKLLG